MMAKTLIQHSSNVNGLLEVNRMELMGLEKKLNDAQNLSKRRGNRVANETCKCLEQRIHYKKEKIRSLERKVKQVVVR